MRSQFDDIRDEDKGLRIANNVFKEERAKKCDWEDQSDVAFYASAKRAERRLKLLNKLVTNRRCSGCGGFKPNSRQWVITKDNKLAVCKSCWMQKFEEREESFSGKILGNPETRFKINSDVFRAAMKHGEFTIRGFAVLAGWSKGYQQKLMNGECRTISENTASVILTVLRESGVVTDDFV